jgi:hypothetical protein
LPGKTAEKILSEMYNKEETKIFQDEKVMGTE